MSGFKPVFKIQGKAYHLIGSLLPQSQNEEPKFAQIYFMNEMFDQIECRMSSNNILKSEIVEEIEMVLRRYNSYAKSFKYAMKSMNSDSLKVYNVTLL